MLSATKLVALIRVVLLASQIPCVLSTLGDAWASRKSDDEWQSFVSPVVCLQRFVDRIMVPTKLERELTKHIESIYTAPNEVPYVGNLTSSEVAMQLLQAHNKSHHLLESAKNRKIITIDYHAFHANRQALTVLSLAAVCQQLGGCRFSNVVDAGGKGDTSFLLHTVFRVPNVGSFAINSENGPKGTYVFTDKHGKLVLAKRLPGSYTPAFYVHNRDGDLAAAPLPVESNSLDLFVSLETLEHLQGSWMLSREIVRTLRVGGLLVATTPNSNSIHHLKNLLLGADTRLHHSYIFDPKVPNATTVHVKEYSLRSMRSWVAWMGLEILMHTTIDYTKGLSDEPSLVAGYDRFFDSAIIPPNWRREMHLIIARKVDDTVDPLRDIYFPQYTVDPTVTYLRRDPARPNALKAAHDRWPLKSDCPEKTDA